MEKIVNLMEFNEECPFQMCSLISPKKKKFTIKLVTIQTLLVLFSIQKTYPGTTKALHGHRNIWYWKMPR